MFRLFCLFSIALTLTGGAMKSAPMVGAGLVLLAAAWRARPGHLRRHGDRP